MLERIETESVLTGKIFRMGKVNSSIETVRNGGFSAGDVALMHFTLNHQKREIDDVHTHRHTHTHTHKHTIFFIFHLKE